MNERFELSGVATAVFWTIMSMLPSTAATVAKIFEAVPGTLGTPAIVIFPWERSCAIPATTGASMALLLL